MEIYTKEGLSRLSTDELVERYRLQLSDELWVDRALKNLKSMGLEVDSEKNRENTAPELDNAKTIV